MADDAPSYMLAEFSLKLQGKDAVFRVEVPVGEVTLAEVLPSLFQFHEQVQALAVAEAGAAGRRVSCRAGCGACCRQLVPISAAEAGLLYDWIATRSPAEQEALGARFAAATGALRERGLLGRLGDRASVRTAEGIRELGLAYFGARVACPFLVDEACSVYAARPLKCREYLVTSPAAFCANPAPGLIELVEFPRTFLHTLLRLSAELDGRGAWMPLALLQQEARPYSPARRPGPELFRRFVSLWAGGG